MKFTFFTFILFLCVGVVCAEDNSTSNDNIKDLIDNCEDDTVRLDEKTYHLNPESETHIALNKSIIIEGTGETIIDGKNTTLYLDVFEENKSGDGLIVIKPIDLYVKNNGHHITFKNITFKDLNLISRHEMEFLDCKFIKTNYTSKELNNTFANCIFDKSCIELSVYDSEYMFTSKIINCTLYDSKILSQTYILIDLVGSDRIFISNSIELRNLKAFNSDILLNHYNVNVTNSIFSNSSLRGSSDKISVFNSSFNKANPTIYYSNVDFEKTTINNSNLKFTAGYYTKGCEVMLKDSVLNKTTLTFNPNFYSNRSKLIIKNSTVGDCDIKAIETDIKIHNSSLNKSTIELHFSNIDLNKSLLYNNGTVKDTIKTNTEIEQVTRDDYGDIVVYNEIYPIKTNYTTRDSYFINASGLYKIDSKDINVNTLFNLTYDKNIIYCVNDTITFRLTDNNGNPISNKMLYVENSNGHNTGLITDKNGKAYYTIEKEGELNLKIYYDLGFNFYSRTMLLAVNLTAHSIDMKLIKDFKNNRFSNIKSSIKIKLINYSNIDLSKQDVLFKVYSGGKYITCHKTTDSNGLALFKIPAKLDAGVHKIQVIFNKKIMKTTSIKIYKAKTIVKAPKITNKFKKSKYFKVTVKNKETKKMLSNVKIKIKVFTGKKYKTYSVKTNKKGIAKINTKKLKIGNHKVIISSGNKNYSISGKILIKIKKIDRWF